MSICTTESPASVRALDAIHTEEDAFAAEVQHLRESFLKDAGECQADKFALFAPRVRDWKNGGTKLQTIGEIVHDEMQHGDFAERVVQVLLMAAAGRGTQRDAQTLLDEMAAHWAHSEATL